MQEPIAKKRLKDRSVIPAWNCAVYNGQILVEDKKGFENFLAIHEGKEGLQLVLKKKVKTRSRNEEKFYHAVVVKMVAEGMDIMREEAHEFLKHMFLRTEERVVLPDARVIRYERTMSTTELSDSAYREYWETVIKWAALPTLPEGLTVRSGLELYIPYPNEAEWDGRDEYFGQ